MSVIKVRNEDYISLTDMLKAKEGEFFFSNWLRNRNTVEFLGIWERLNNPDFNYVEFDIIKSMVGLNNFRLSAKEWMERTHAVGIISKTGRYGGTFAHKDIAFELAKINYHIHTSAVGRHLIPPQEILQEEEEICPLYKLLFIRNNLLSIIL